MKSVIVIVYIIMTLCQSTFRTFYRFDHLPIYEIETPILSALSSFALKRVQLNFTNASIQIWLDSSETSNIFNKLTNMKNVINGDWKILLFTDKFYRPIIHCKYQGNDCLPAIFDEWATIVNNNFIIN
jgi:hypothetical protein